MVIQHRGIGPPVADLKLGDLLRVGHIADVEERYLDALVPGEIAFFGGNGLLPDSDNVVLVVGMQVVRVASDLEFPENLGLAGIGQVNDEERIHLLEGHQVASAAHESRRIDLLTRCQVLQTAGDVQTLV